MRVTRLSDLPEIPVGGRGLLWKPLRHTLGIEAFGVNAYTARAAGDEVVEDHDETGSGAGHHEELYVVVAGHATFSVDDEEVDAPVGTCVFLEDPAQRRAATAREPGTVVLAIGGARGEPYRVSPWEFTFRASAADGPDVAQAIVREGLERYPDNASLLYNLACYESLGGHHEAALGHLRRAVELEPGYARHAAGDPDFEPIRADPRFPQPAG
jgi:hypothetical protein